MREFDLNGLRLAEYQGELFEKSVSFFKCSSAIFLRRFLHSELLKSIDKNQSAVLSLSSEDGLKAIEEEFGYSEYGEKKYSKESMFWMGYLYRYISYTRDETTQLIMKLVPYKTLVELYPVYHTQDSEWCIRNILEKNGLPEEIFDKNYRLKKAISEAYAQKNKKTRKNS